MTDPVKSLIDASSLGSPGARMLRERGHAERARNAEAIEGARIIAARQPGPCDCDEWPPGHIHTLLGVGWLAGDDPEEGPTP